VNVNNERHMNIGAQRLCIWCGPVMVVLWVLAFVFLSKFIPPPAPSKTPEQIVAMFATHTNRIRLGLVISLFSCALLVPFCAAIAAQIRKTEGQRSVLAQTQLVSGGLLCVEFLIPFAIWQTAAYRVGGRSPEMIQMLNDMAWLMFLGIISSACVQVAALGVAVLRDKQAEPVFPRWFGWYNIWAAIVWVPAAIIPFFKSGLFAWNGVAAFWIPFVVLAIWFAITTVLLLRAVNRDETDERALSGSIVDAKGVGRPSC
jgi:hypothetical protein